MDAAAKKPNAIFRFLQTAEDLFLSAILLTLVLFSFFQLIMKNLPVEFAFAGRLYTILPFKWLIDAIGPGFNWGDAFLRQLVLWLAVMGAAVATKQDRHINVEIASKFLPKKWGVAIRIFTDAFTAVVCGLLAYTGYDLVRTDMTGGSTAFANVPGWVMEMIIPFGFGIISIRYVRYFFLHLFQAFGVIPLPKTDATFPNGGAA